MTDLEKAANARSYGYPVSLEPGGDPNDPRNLGVEPNDRPGAASTTNTKNQVENAAHAAVCSGKLGLRAAQEAIATDWPALGRQLGLAIAG